MLLETKNEMITELGAFVIYPRTPGLGLQSSVWSPKVSSVRAQEPSMAGPEMGSEAIGRPHHNAGFLRGRRRQVQATSQSSWQTGREWAGVLVSVAQKCAETH